MGHATRVLAIVGPTGTGKSALAAEVARRSGAEIIGADSVQVYRGMDIGTAKPSPELRAEITHHAIDIADPDDPMSAGRYAAIARVAAHDILSRGRPVILCGGTGLYARAFAGGLVEGIESDPDLRTELERRPTEELYRELCEEDPARAAELLPRDRLRIVRALEAGRLGGRPLSELQASHGFQDRPFDVCWLGLDLDRAVLRDRLTARVDRMFADGFVEEVRALHARGYSPELRSLKSIGYREVGEMLAGRLPEPEARQAITVATHRYAKRQRTWFRSEPGLEWVDVAQRETAVSLALARLAKPAGPPAAAVPVRRPLSSR